VIDARAATKGKKTDWRLRRELNKRWRERLGKISEARPDRLPHVQERTAANEPRLAGDASGGRKLSMDGARPEQSPQAALHETGASASARSAVKPPSLRLPPRWRRQLVSDDPLEVIRMLCMLAGRGDSGREAEEAIAGLLTETARGKVLSRWCYYALTKISANPQQYLDGYVAAAAGLRMNVVPPGQEGVLAGPGLKTADEPELPEGLRKTSHVAWVTGVEAVIRLLHDDRRWYNATDCLGGMDAPGDVLVPRLATALLDSKIPAHIRQRASMTIGEYGYSTVAEKALLKGLGHEDADTRGSCARVLGRLCGPYLGRTEAVTHPHPEVVVAALTEVLKDPEAAARKGAAYGLGWARRNDKKAVDLLLKLIKSDPDPVTRRTATIAVGQIACELHEKANAANPEQIIELARAVVPVLVEVLRGEPQGDQRFLIHRAAKSLSYFGEAASEGIPELHRLLRSATGNPRDQQLRAVLISSLGRIGPASDRAIPEIVASSRYECCRYSVAFALGRIGRGGEDVENVLLDLTQAEDHWIRREAAKSLGLVARESEQIIKALERLRHDKDDYVREEAAKALFAIHARATGADDPGAGDVF
jgi:HEAT repeat protein